MNIMLCFYRNQKHSTKLKRQEVSLDFLRILEKSTFPMEKYNKTAKK
jgi:hypothetical protein